MTPRERMNAFLEGQPVDRIPNGLGACETAGLHNVAYHKLKRILGVDDPSNRICTFMNNAIFEPAVINAMEGDMILLGTRMCPSRFWSPSSAKEWKPLRMWDIDMQVACDWKFRQDVEGVWWWDDRMCPPGSFYFDAPSGDSVGFSFDKINEPSPAEFNPSHTLPDERLKQLEEDAQWLHENTDLCIVCGETIQDLQYKPGGTQSWWMRMVSEPDACHEFLDKAVDAAISHLKQLHQAVGKYCMMLLIADDMGDTRGITIGADLWRQIYKPHYKRLFTEWHKITTMKIVLHSCGSMTDILEDLIECGVDIYNPVQISSNNMNPVLLKEQFGGRIIFYGGALDAVSLREDTDPSFVYEDVKANITTLGRDGGYIFAGVHNLPGNLPESHLKAMVDAYNHVKSN